MSEVDPLLGGSKKLDHQQQPINSNSNGEGSRIDKELMRTQSSVETIEVHRSGCVCCGPFRNIIVLSVGFFMIFFAFNTVQTLESSLAGHMGYWSLATIYACFGLSSLVIAAPLTSMLKAKPALILGGSTYVIFIAANLQPGWYTLVPAASFIGLGAGILWTAQGTYLTHAAANYARSINAPTKSALGLFNGIFGAILQSAQVLGNIVSSMAILGQPASHGDLDNTNGPGHADDLSAQAHPPKHERAVIHGLFTLFFVVSLIGVITFFFLGKEMTTKSRRKRKRKHYNDSFKMTTLQRANSSTSSFSDLASHSSSDGLGEPETRVVSSTSLSGNLAKFPASPASSGTGYERVHGMDTFDIEATAVQDQRDKDKEEEDVGKILRMIARRSLSVMALVADLRMALLIPLMVYTGMEMGFLFGDFTKEVINETKGTGWIGIVLAVYGIANACSSAIFGKLSDVVGKRLLVIIGFSTHIAFYLFYQFFLWKYSLQAISTRGSMLFLTAGVIGVGDSCWNTFCAIMMAVFFIDRAEAAFANFKFWQAIGFVLSFTLGPVIILEQKLWLLVGALLFSVGSIVLLDTKVASLAYRKKVEHIGS